MDNYIGEIRIFAGTFAPEGWEFCNGQVLPVSENQTLFNLLGATYGGDGQTTFALPDLRSRAVIGLGQGPGLSAYTQGQRAGQESVPLLASQIPAHQHTVQASLRATIAPGTSGQASPADAYFSDQGDPAYISSAITTMAPDAVSGQTNGTGGSQAHTNLQPLLATYYIIATQGSYPPQQ
jgi:microcystin-dependent protein